MMNDLVGEESLLSNVNRSNPPGPPGPGGGSGPNAIGMTLDAQGQPFPER